jgi:hypothetical protein
MKREGLLGTLPHLTNGVLRVHSSLHASLARLMVLWVHLLVAMSAANASNANLSFVMPYNGKHPAPGVHEGY